jgi:para-aminobenzoate synthetase component 1
MLVNLTRREDAAFEGDPWALYEDLVEAHPAPFAAFLEGPGFALASCSPERFLHRRADSVEARPIKGTVARGIDEEEDRARRAWAWLAHSAKNRAENVMIVDLMRNDLGRVAAIGSVHVPELFALESYASVWQMVSAVTARLRPAVGVAELLRACWPPGSMTGAPKVKAMEIIETLEPVRRGWYAGSVGYLDCRGNLDLSVVIRSAIVTRWPRHGAVRRRHRRRFQFRFRMGRDRGQGRAHRCSPGSVTPARLGNACRGTGETHGDGTSR